MTYIPENPNGQATMANSSPMVLASDQSAIPVTNTAQNTLIGAVTETAPASDTASSGLNGRLQRIAQNITSFIGKFPSSLGKKTNATSLSVTLSSDEPAIPTSVADGANVALGAKADAAASSDTGAFSGISFWKYLHQKLTGYFGGSISNVAITTQAKVLAGGKSVDITVPTASTIGNSQMFLFDSVTGALKVVNADLKAAFDSVSMSELTAESEFILNCPSGSGTPYAAKDYVGDTHFDFTNVSSGSLTPIAGTSPTVYKDGGGYITKILVKADDANLIGKTLILVLSKGNYTFSAIDNTAAFTGYASSRDEVCKIEVPITAELITGNYPASGQLEKLIIPYKVPFTFLRGRFVIKEGFTPTSAANKIWVQMTVTKND